MAIGGLCIFAASIVFTVAVIMGNKQEEHAIVCATAVRVVLFPVEFQREFIIAVANIEFLV